MFYGSHMFPFYYKSQDIDFLFGLDCKELYEQTNAASKMFSMLEDIYFISKLNKKSGHC